jgi:hypothetical protein
MAVDRQQHGHFGKKKTYLPALAVLVVAMETVELDVGHVEGVIRAQGRERIVRL